MTNDELNEWIKREVNINTYMDIPSLLNVLACYVGGNHFDEKQTEYILRIISSRISDMTMEYYDNLEKSLDIFGIPDSMLFNYRKEKHTTYYDENEEDVE